MQEIRASMAGSIWKIHVTVGEQVKAGQEVIILESMKMEIPIIAEKAGTVTSLKLSEGDFVNESDVIILIE